MIIDPSEPLRLHNPELEDLEQLPPRALLRLTRRTLLNIYSPQQTAIWLRAHASGDPVEVAHKARRLCRTQHGEPLGLTASPSTASSMIPIHACSTPIADEFVEPTGPFGGLRDAATVLARIDEVTRATIKTASRAVVTLEPQVAADLLGRHGTLDPPSARHQSSDTGGAAPDGRHSVVLPLVGRGGLLGTLYLYADGSEAFSDEDRSVAAELAAHAGVALGGSRTAVEAPHAMGEDEPHRRVEETRMQNRRHAETSPSEDVGDAARRVTTVATADLPTTADHRPTDTGATTVGGLSDLQVHEILLAAIRDMFTSEHTDEIQSVLLETVDRLGGRITRASEVDQHSVPVDLSLNVGEPLLAVPTEETRESGEHLRCHLPRLLEDARRAVDRVERSSRLASAAEHDVLTGLFNRRAYERFAGRLRPGDVLVLLDFDDFKTVNDTQGHLVGDQVLRVFGSVLRDQMRITEQAVRLGGDEFLIVLEGPGEGGAELLLERLEVAWQQRRPVPVSFSAGVATVSSSVDAALEAADRSLYEHKRAGGPGRAPRRGG